MGLLNCLLCVCSRYQLVDDGLVVVKFGENQKATSTRASVWEVFEG